MRQKLSRDDPDQDGVPQSMVAVLTHLQRLRAAAGDRVGAVATMSAALMSGESVGAVARAAGIPVADAYTVVALGIAGESLRRIPVQDESDTGAARLARVQEAVYAVCGEQALPLLGVHGGTVLVPVGEHGDLPPELAPQLSRAAHAPVVAVAVPAQAPGIPRATVVAHELLEIIHRLHYPPRLYRFRELSLEYQLTRPGPATEYLQTVVERIAAHPDLLETLRLHIDNGFQRQTTARLLKIHCNTVDYRLRRIRELTGLDPNWPSGLWYLQSALIVHAYHCADLPPRPRARTATQERM
ncbi:helix-turn-helix domain-containing protein [Nocardia sp. CA2R105]|uniref:PucR family transcriptional regulator n=1 Tax=Nocardia coffeae TaxID=2873381 RepID=UPI001CA6E2D4|nr:helix-turn-helix domain-containing protein [Nocardia coffeae]MBY8859457.1 helix-turn-helix domain-containing protein [Nocardia coffeae]